MSRRKHIVTRVLVSALAVATLAPATASANVDLEPNQDLPRPITVPRVASVRFVRDGSGFNWGDAGIGAAAGIGLSILGAAGGGAVRRRGGAASGRAATN